jgi:hypothetical protein
MLMHSLMWLVAMAAVWVVVSMLRISLRLCREHAWPNKSVKLCGVEILIYHLVVPSTNQYQANSPFHAQDLSSRANC